jgi:hypothetical protein
MKKALWITIVLVLAFGMLGLMVAQNAKAGTNPFMQRDIHERGRAQRHMWQPTIPLPEMRERWLQARELRDCDQWEGLLHERHLGPFPALLQVWL